MIHHRVTSMRSTGFLAEYGDLDWDTSLTEQLREWLDEQNVRLE